jgi:hypothetical protein
MAGLIRAGGYFFERGYGVVRIRFYGEIFQDTVISELRCGKMGKYDSSENKNQRRLSAGSGWTGFGTPCSYTSVKYLAKNIKKNGAIIRTSTLPMYGTNDRTEVIIPWTIAVTANMTRAGIYENHDYDKNPVNLYILQ